MSILDVRQHPVALEMFSAGYCNMDCAYCYIPKNKALKEVDSKIKEKMKNGEYVKEIKELYGDNLKMISLWGTEPSINLDLFNEHLLPQMMEEFPNLYHIGFSTNLLENTDKVLEFVETMNNIKNKEELSISLQFSNDGLEITNENRHPGAKETIESNYRKIVSCIDQMDLKDNINIKCNFKPTLSIKNYKELLDNRQIEEWYEYFFKEFDFFVNNVKRNKKNLKMQLGANPTLVLPGDYTKEDGEVFGRFCRVQHNLSRNMNRRYMKNSPLNGYANRLKRVVRHHKEMGTKAKMFICSAGDSQLGLNTNQTFGMCHRLFYVHEDEYLNECKKKGVVQYENEVHLRKNYTAKIDDELSKSRLMYMNRQVHDFWRFKVSVATNIIREAAAAGQVRKAYEDEELARNLATFILSTCNCPAENAAITGSQSVIPVSLIRIWGNGAFKATLDEYLYWNAAR